jgi:hypothetical protein
MAEVTGQIGSEYVELDNAATEATLQELLKATASMAKNAKMDVKDAQQEIDKLFKSSKKLNPELLRQAAQQKKTVIADKKREDQLKLLQDTEKEYAETKKQSSQALKNFGSGVKETIDKLISITSELSSMGDSISSANGLFRHIPIVGGMLSAGLGAIAKAAESTHNALVQAGQVGAGFGGSMSKMIGHASQAGLTFDQFAGLIAKNGEALAYFEGGVQNGSKEFAKMSKLMRTEVTTGGLAALGYTTELANESMLVYTRRLGRLGALQGKQASDLVKSSREYMINLDGLSKLTGKSKQELQAEQDRLMADSAVRLLTTRMAQIDDVAAQQFTNTLTAAGGLGTAMGDFIATGVSRGPEGEFIATQMPLLMAAQEEARAEYLRTGVVSQATSKKLQEVLQQESKIIMADKDRSDLLAAILKDNYGSIMQEVMNQAARTTTMAKAQDQARTEASQPSEAAGREAARQQVAELSNKINQELAKQLPLVTAALGKLTDFLENTLLRALTWMSDNLPLVETAMWAVVGAAVALKGALLIKSGIQGARALMGRGPGGFVGPPAPGAGAGAKAGGGIMSTMGRAASGVMRFAGPIGLIISAGVAIHGAAEGVSKAAENFDLAEGQVATMGQKIASGFGGAIESLSFGLIDGGWVARGVHQVGEAYANAFTAVKDGVVRLWENPEETMKAVGDAIHAGFSRAKDFVTGMWKGMSDSKLGEAISSGFNSARDKVIELGKNLADAVSPVFNSARDKVTEWGKSLVDGYETAKQMVAQNWETAKTKISEWGQSIANGYQSLKEQAMGLVGSAVGKAQELAPKVQEALTSTANAAKEAVSSGWKKVTTFFSKSPTEVVQAVSNNPVVSTAAAIPATPTAGAPNAQMSSENLLASLNTKLDSLIRISNMLYDNNERQLTVQKGLSGDLLKAVG